MTEHEERQDDNELREAQEGKGYGAGEGEREEGLEREASDEPGDDE